MKLFLYDKFMDSFIRLPKTEQKKTMEFMEKFKRDPRTSAINLEKIHTFKDPQLRTARVGLSYRAIIHVSPEDEIFHLLWVDHHDEAMRWAENKVFEWNRYTQSYQVYDVETRSVEQPVSLSADAAFMAQFNDENLLQIGVPEILLPSVRQIDTLNDLEAMEQYLPSEVFERLFYLLDGDTLQTVLSEVETGKSEDPNVDVNGSANNRRFFFEITDVDMAVLFADDFEKWKIFLHPSQHQLAFKDHNGPVKVTGLAGTGKTVCALHRAKFLSERNTVSSSQPLFFTTFTKSLTSNLRGSFKSLGIDDKKVFLQNIHAFAFDRAKMLGLIPNESKIVEFTEEDVQRELWEEALDTHLTALEPDFLKSEYELVILHQGIDTEAEYLTASRIGRSQKIGRKERLEIWRLVSAYRDLLKKKNYVNRDEVTNLLCKYYQAATEKPFSHIVADEIQDFSTPELRLLRSLVSEKPNDLFLVGDPLQKIYDRRINFSKAGINVRGARSRKLKINYRTTEEIRRIAVSTVRQIPLDNLDGETESKNGYLSLTHGEAPQYHVFPTQEEESDFIVQAIRNMAEHPDDTAVHFHDICIAARLKSSLSDIKKILHREKIPFWDLLTETGNKTGVRLSTFHSTKGLEFRVALLIGVNDKTLPLHPKGYNQWERTRQKEHDNAEYSLIYVAMTRAIQRLVLTGWGRGAVQLEEFAIFPVQ